MHLCVRAGSPDAVPPRRSVGGVMIPEIVKRVIRRAILRTLDPIGSKGTPLPEDYRLAHGGGCSG